MRHFLGFSQVKKIMISKSLNQLKRELEALKKYNLKKISYEDYFEYVKKCFEGYTQVYASVRSEADPEGYGGIFRARKVDGNQPFLLLKDLWAPTSGDVKKMGRCHKINQSKFYCANHFSVSLIECRAENNSYWVMTEYETINEVEFYVLPVGRKIDDLNNNLEAPLDMEILKAQKNMLIEKYIRKVFKQVIHKDHQYQYLKTCAISDYLLTNDHTKKMLVGLLYPSVASRLKGHNLCFDDEISKKVLKIRGVEFIKVIEIDFKQEKIIFERIAIGKLEEEKILWTWDSNYKNDELNK